MPAASLLTLLDDIASVLDDVAAMTKVAATKTAGVLGDDLALNAQQVSGVKADRELPVVWAVAKGSLINKAILVPAALAISALAPWGVLPLLMVGGAYLCYEGFEKLAHKIMHRRHKHDKAHHAKLLAAIVDPAVDIVAFERSKIKGAIRTDFVLSAEIIVITLGTVATAGFWAQVAVLAGIAVIMTVGVYGLVACIVKLDDLGLFLSLRGRANAGRRALSAFGRAILFAAPFFLKALSVVGTAAMFLVGGGILVHGLPGGEQLVHSLAHEAGAVPGVGGVLEAVSPLLLGTVLGVAAGAVVLAAVSMLQRARRLMRRRKPTPAA